MTWNPTSPLTGAAVTGLTSPTYTIVADTPRINNTKQRYVSALGGTQTGVLINSQACPFTITAFRPAVFRPLTKVNPGTGLLPTVPRNNYKVIIRKGVLPLAGQPYSPMVINISMDVPSGAELADPNQIAAALSIAGGLLTDQASGMLDTILTGAL